MYFILDEKESVEANVDVRKQFFYSILQSSGKSKTFESVSKEQAISDLKKRSRSESDLDQSVDATDKVADDGTPNDKLDSGRPRSASPTVGTQVKGDGDIEEQETAVVDQEQPKDENVKEDTSVDDKAGDKANGIATLKSRAPFQRHRSEDLSTVNKSASAVPLPAKSKSFDYDIGEDAKMKTTFIGSGVPEEDDKESKGPMQESLSQSTPRGKCRPYIDIPEFSWSPWHQRLLTELLFAIESDIQVWKT